MRPSDARKLRRPCTAYYAASVKNAISHIVEEDFAVTVAKVTTFVRNHIIDINGNTTQNASKIYFFKIDMEISI